MALMPRSLWEHPHKQKSPITFITIIITIVTVILYYLCLYIID